MFVLREILNGVGLLVTDLFLQRNCIGAVFGARRPWFLREGMGFVLARVPEWVMLRPFNIKVRFLGWWYERLVLVVIYDVHRVGLNGNPNIFVIIGDFYDRDRVYSVTT